MRFADRLIEHHTEVVGHINPEGANPSTSVQTLVRELRNKGQGF